MPDIIAMTLAMLLLTEGERGKRGGEGEVVCADFKKVLVHVQA